MVRPNTAGFTASFFSILWSSRYEIGMTGDPDEQAANQAGLSDSLKSCHNQQITGMALKGRPIRLCLVFANFSRISSALKLSTWHVPRRHCVHHQHRKRESTGSLMSVIAGLMRMRFPIAKQCLFIFPQRNMDGDIAFVIGNKAPSWNDCLHKLCLHFWDPEHAVTQSVRSINSQEI